MSEIMSRNQKITEDIQKHARELFQDGGVDVIIGYAKGTFPLNSAPIFVHNEEEVEKLSWNNFSHVNLASVSRKRSWKKVPSASGRIMLTILEQR